MIERVRRTILRKGRKLLYRARYRHVDWTGVSLDGKVTITGPGRLVLEPGVAFDRHSGGNDLYLGDGATVRIGRGTYVNGVGIHATADVTIGPDCLLGSAWITTTNFHPSAPARRRDPAPSRSVTLGRNVWLANRVVVLPGVTIGDNSAASIGTVVSESVPAGVLVTSHQQHTIRTFDAGE